MCVPLVFPHLVFALPFSGEGYCINFIHMWHRLLELASMLFLWLVVRPSSPSACFPWMPYPDVLHMHGSIGESPSNIKPFVVVAVFNSCKISLQHIRSSAGRVVQAVIQESSVMGMCTADLRGI